MSTKQELLEVIYDLCYSLTCGDAVALTEKTLEENNYKDSREPKNRRSSHKPWELGDEDRTWRLT